MAKKAKKRSNSKPSDENVVRIKAGSASKAVKREAESKEAVVTKTVAKTSSSRKSVKTESKSMPKRNKKGVLRMLAAIGGYFKGAWIELRQVRWPNRRATWGMTIAVLIYTAIFVLIILLLDAGFKYLFDLMLGK